MKLLTKSRHNLPLSFIEPLEDEANEGDFLSDDDERRRLAFILYEEGEETFQAIFYRNQSHDSVREFSFNSPVFEYTPEAA